MSAPIFTFVTEKGGGTYIEQFRAADIEAAVLIWHEKSHTIPGPYESFGMEVTRVSEVKTVWCISGHDPAGRFYLSHIVGPLAE